MSNNIITKTLGPLAKRNSRRSRGGSTLSGKPKGIESIRTVKTSRGHNKTSFRELTPNKQ